MLEEENRSTKRGQFLCLDRQEENDLAAKRLDARGGNHLQARSELKKHSPEARLRHLEVMLSGTETALQRWVQPTRWRYAGTTSSRKLFKCLVSVDKAKEVVEEEVKTWPSCNTLAKDVSKENRNKGDWAQNTKEHQRAHGRSGGIWELLTGCPIETTRAGPACGVVLKHLRLSADSDVVSLPDRCVKAYPSLNQHSSPGAIWWDENILKRHLSLSVNLRYDGAGRTHVLPSVPLLQRQARRKDSRKVRQVAQWKNRIMKWSFGNSPMGHANQPWPPC